MTNSKDDLESLWRNGDFVRLWAGQTISELGSGITVLALPLLAALSLHASALQISLLTAASTSAFLLVALQAGALVDRWRRKRVLIRTDVWRALLISSIPAAHLLGVLTIVQLYLVAAATSVLAVFFDVAYQSYLPELVAREQLTDGNGKLAATAETANVAAPALAGGLVSAIGAAWAVALDAGSFLGSALFTLLIRRPDPAPTPRPPGQRLRTEIKEGLDFVRHHPILRPITACTASVNFFSSAAGSVEIVFLVRTLHAGPGVVGAVFALGAVGGVIGALSANRFARRLGSARVVWVSIVATVPFVFARPLAFSGWGVLLVALSLFGGGVGAVVYNVAQVSYRQAVTPAHLLGRMNASVRFVVWGVIPLGAVVGGLLAVTVGVREALFVAAAGESLGCLWLIFSPLFGARDIADAEAAVASAGGRDRSSPTDRTNPDRG